MSPRAEQVLAVVVCAVLLAVWIVHPGGALVLIGGAIGGLAVLAWIARKLGI